MAPPLTASALVCSTINSSSRHSYGPPHNQITINNPFNRNLIVLGFEYLASRTEHVFPPPIPRPRLLVYPHII